jgi:hypothetical protein
VSDDDGTALYRYFQNKLIAGIAQAWPETGDGRNQVGDREKIVQELVHVGFADARQQPPAFENIFVFQDVLIDPPGLRKYSAPAALTDQSNQPIRSASFRTRSRHQDVRIDDGFVDRNVAAPVESTSAGCLARAVSR